MKRIFGFTAAVALGVGATQAPGQSVIYNFSDGTSQGWANAGFGSTPQASVVTIGGNNYINIAYVGYQSANVASASQLGGGTYSEDNYNTLNGPFNNAMYAAVNNPGGYNLSYNYYINTSTFTTPGTYFQISSFVNPESGFYGQDSANEVALNGTQVASGSVFSGTVTVPFTVYGTDSSAATEVGFRLGLILNGNGTGMNLDFTDISVAPVPEPASLALCGMGLLGGLLALRRRNS